jgi:hypothetical protein
VYEKTPTHARNLEVTYGFRKRIAVHCGMPRMP